MAYWVQNWVEFSGNENNLQEVKKMFKEMEQKEQETKEGQKPSFVSEPKECYFFDIHTDETETVSYTTRWSPNILDLVAIANHFKLNFVCNYEESGNQIFGKAVFTFGEVKPKFYDLDDTDFELYEYHQGTDIYTYNGEEYECESNILETIFEKKFNIAY
jgi:hypothetical protein